MADEPTTESTPLEHLEAMRHVEEPIRAAVERRVHQVPGFIAEARADDGDTPPPAADDATPQDARHS